MAEVVGMGMDADSEDEVLREEQRKRAVSDIISWPWGDGAPAPSALRRSATPKKQLADPPYDRR